VAVNRRLKKAQEFLVVSLDFLEAIKINQKLKKAQEFLVVSLDFLEAIKINQKLKKAQEFLVVSLDFLEEVAKNKVLHRIKIVVVLLEVSCQVYLVEEVQMIKRKVQDFLDGD
jgi:hypothetical protein